MRTLILYGPESESQMAVSRALSQAFVARGDTCLIVGAQELLGAHPSVSMLRALEQAFSTPRGFAFLSVGDSFVRLGKPKTPVYEINARYVKLLSTLLQEGEFDAVLCLHRYPTEAVSLLKKTLVFSARCCFVSCDYTCVPFLEETRLDHYFTPHGSFSDTYVSRGISRGKIVCSGVPVPEDWFRAEEKADARARLNLPQNMPCYLIPYAKDAAHAVEALLFAMRGENGRVCVTAPDGAPPKSPFVARFSGDTHVIVMDESDPLALYCSACDVMLASPSGPLSTIAALRGIPLVHLPPCDEFEAQTARFFAARGMSLSGAEDETCARLALILAKNDGQKDTMRASQRDASLASGAQNIVRFLHEGRL